MVRPDLLKPGDKVRIVATARKVAKQDMAYAVEVLRSWGLEVVIGDSLFEADNQFAGPDHLRRADLQVALDDPECKAIFCARGGYGTARLLSQIDWRGILTYPKWVIGFSDITVLLSQLYHIGIEAVHGIMPGLFRKQEAAESISMLKSLLFEGPKTLKAPATIQSKAGTASGHLVGGNLSIVSISEGTPYRVPAKGNILFLEDLDEYLYHIDRMLVHLKLSGTLEGLSGLVVGHMTDMNDNPIPFGKEAYEIIHAHVDEYDFPVGYGFDIGHDYPNHPVIHGAPCTLTVHESGESELIFG